MARRVDDNRDTRSEILRVAFVAFSDDGFGSVTTRRIAGEAGVNIAMLSYHFGSKDGLYRAVVDDVYARLNAHSDAFLRELPSWSERFPPGVHGRPSRAMVEAVLDRTYRLACEERRGIRILLREVLDTGAYRIETRDEHLVPHMRRIAPFVSELFGIAPARTRDLLVTLSMLLGRFVVQDVEMLRRSFEVENDDDVHARVVGCLVETACAFLLSPAPASPGAVSPP